MRARAFHRVRHHERDSGIRRAQRRDLARRRGLSQERHRQQHHQRRIDEQDQPPESRRDVLQPEKIGEAREIVADETEQHDGPGVLAADGRAPAFAPGPCRGREKERERKDHPQREQRDRVDDVAVGELDQDGAQREAHDARDRHRDADGAVGGRGSHREDSVMRRFVLASREERMIKL